MPVVAVEKEDFLLGGAANVVNNIHSLGGKGALCGVVGDDVPGQQDQESAGRKGDRYPRHIRRSGKTDNGEDPDYCPPSPLSATGSD